MRKKDGHKKKKKNEIGRKHGENLCAHYAPRIYGISWPFLFLLVFGCDRRLEEGVDVRTELK